MSDKPKPTTHWVNQIQPKSATLQVKCCHGNTITECDGTCTDDTRCTPPTDQPKPTTGETISGEDAGNSNAPRGSSGISRASALKPSPEPTTGEHEWALKAANEYYRVEAEHDVYLGRRDALEAIIRDALAKVKEWK